VFESRRLWKKPSREIALTEHLTLASATPDLALAPEQGLSSSLVSPGGHDLVFCDSVDLEMLLLSSSKATFSLLMCPVSEQTAAASSAPVRVVSSVFASHSRGGL
jgi:hypothetical protein